jgi:ribose 1,5-bisphosphokinase
VSSDTSFDFGQKIGPGTLALVVGPSGAGKDALINGAREVLERDHRFLFVERVVTRPSTAVEKHGSLDEAEFAAVATQGGFALTWRAHGLLYGVPASVDRAIGEGRTAVVNGSRAASNDARRRYLRTFLVLVDCPLDVRAGRLAARGRETEAEIRARLERSVSSFDPAEADLRIDNSGPLAMGVDMLVTALQSMPQ